MNLQEYRAKLQSDEQYKEAEEKLKPLFELADEVLRLRLENGWSQTELARRAVHRTAESLRAPLGGRLGNNVSEDR